MKVLLISPAIEEEHRGELNVDSHYPIGLGYIHAAAEAAGHEVRTLFLNNYSYNNCLAIYDKEVEEFRPMVVGVQMMSHNRVCGYKIIERTPEEMAVVVGGIHATVMHEQIVRKYPRVSVVVGEGEETFVELLDHFNIRDGRDKNKIKGLARMVGDKLVVNPRRPLTDLDTLPFTKHEAFAEPGKGIAGLLTSRGCPFECSFCVLDNFSRKKVRMRSIDSVVDEVQHIMKTFPALRQIWIHDDNFLMNNDRVLEFCAEIKRRGIVMDFVCSARFKQFTPQVINALEDAGFSQILFGLESGSEKILNLANKKLKLDTVCDAFDSFKDSTIKITAFLIIGLEGETKETIAETVSFVKKLQKINYTYYEDFGVCMIYPGTRVYELAKQDGQMDDDYWMSEAPVPYYTADFSKDRLFEMKKEIQTEIALSQILTEDGFLAQVRLLPSIVNYAYKFGMPFFIEHVEAVLRRHYPDRVGRLLFDKRMRRRALLLIEKGIFDEVVRRNGLDAKEYFKRYKAGRK